MSIVRFSASAVLAATVIFSAGCATSDSMPRAGGSTCACGPGMFCFQNQCYPYDTGAGGTGVPTGVGGPPAPGSGAQPGAGGGSGAGAPGNGGAAGSTNPDTGGAGAPAGSGGTPGGNPNPGSGGSGGGASGGSANGGGANGAYCASCSSDADCGGGNNFCLAFSFGDYCGTDCSNGQACPSGASCVGIGDGSGNVVGMNCVPSTTDCSGVTTGGGATGSGGSGGGSGSGSGSCTTDTWSSFGSSFFKNYCNSCHGSQYSSHGAVQSQLGSIASSISSGNMPTGGVGLSSSMRSRILDYLNCGAP